VQDVGKLILRLMCAGLILFHGIAKLFHGVGFIEKGLAAWHLPAVIAYGVFIGEIVAPLFILLGLWTRVAAGVVMFNLIVAVALAAHRNAFVIQRTGAWGLEAEAFFFLSALVILLLGAGRYSVTRGQGSLD
jgi:putative oxidoreductase